MHTYSVPQQRPDGDAIKGEDSWPQADFLNQGHEWDRRDTVTVHHALHLYRIHPYPSHFSRPILKSRPDREIGRINCSREPTLPGSNVFYSRGRCSNVAGTKTNWNCSANNLKRCVPIFNNGICAIVNPFSLRSRRNIVFKNAFNLARHDILNVTSKLAAILPGSAANSFSSPHPHIYGSSS